MFVGVLCFHRQPFRVAAGVKCRVTAVKRLPALRHGADYIFISFGIIYPNLVTLKAEYRLSGC